MNAIGKGLSICSIFLAVSSIEFLSSCEKVVNELTPPDVALAELVGPRAPEPVSPKNGRIFTTVTQVTLRWKIVSAASAYTIHVATDTSFEQMAFAARVDTTFARTSALAWDKYYWRLTALNSDSVRGPWSEVWAYGLRSAILE